MAKSRSRLAKVLADHFGERMDFGIAAVKEGTQRRVVAMRCVPYDHCDLILDTATGDVRFWVPCWFHAKAQHAWRHQS